MDSCLIPHTRIYSWVKDLNVRPETVKLLEKNTGEKLHDIYLGKDFLNMTPKARATKTKIDMWNYIKLKSFYTANEAVNKMERQPTEWKKIFANHVLPGGTVVKNPPANAGDTVSVPGPGKSHMPQSN